MSTVEKNQRVHYGRRCVSSACPRSGFELEPGVPPLNIYRALRRVNPSPYMYYLRMDELNRAWGTSPEMLGARVGAANWNTVRSRATRKTRRQTRQEDLRLEKELLADRKKERAETHNAGRPGTQ